MVKNFLIILFMFFFTNCSESKKFNSLDWKNWVESESEPNTRWLMREDLLMNHDLKKYSKEKIIELLGNPDIENNNELHYFLGTTGNGINIGTLIIKFQGSTVTKIDVTQG